MLHIYMHCSVVEKGFNTVSVLNLDNDTLLSDSVQLL